jgi:hypothetical protein
VLAGKEICALCRAVDNAGFSGTINIRKRRASVAVGSPSVCRVEILYRTAVYEVLAQYVFERALIQHLKLTRLEQKTGAGSGVGRDG